MKQKIIIFFVGLLTGAILSTGSILTYTLVTGANSETTQNSGMMQGPGGGTPPSDMGGQGGMMPGNTTNNSTNNTQNSES